VNHPQIITCVQIRPENICRLFFLSCLSFSFSPPLCYFCPLPSVTFLFPLSTDYFLLILDFLLVLFFLVIIIVTTFIIIIIIIITTFITITTTTTTTRRDLQDRHDGGGLLRAGEGGVRGCGLLPHGAVDEPGAAAAGPGRGVPRGHGDGAGLPQLLRLPAGGDRESPGDHQETAHAG